MLFAILDVVVRVIVVGVIVLAFVVTAHEIYEEVRTFIDRRRERRVRKILNELRQMEKERQDDLDQ